jgi:hypothetical protein
MLSTPSQIDQWADLVDETLSAHEVMRLLDIGVYEYLALPGLGERQQYYLKHQFARVAISDAAAFRTWLAAKRPECVQLLDAALVLRKMKDLP